MGRMLINIYEVIDAARYINSAKSHISSAKNSFIQIQGNIDDKILNRSDIRSRLGGVRNQLYNISARIDEISATVQNSAYQYKQTDERVDYMKRQLNTSVKVNSRVGLSSNWSKYFTVSSLDLAVKSNAESKDDKGKLFESGLKLKSKILKVLSKLTSKKSSGKSNDLGLTSSVMSYISGLCSFLRTEYTDGLDLTSGVLKLTQNSASMWDGTYKYLEKKLAPLQASRFGKKFQTKVGIVSLVGNACGFTSDVIGTFKVLVNSDAEVSEKINSVLTTTNSGLGVVRSAINLKYGQKVLTRGVTAKYQWGVAAKNASKLSNALTCVSLLSVAISSVKGFNTKYSEVTKDGTYDAGDMGETGTSFAVHGLTSIVGLATFGISDVLGLSEKADDIANGLTSFAETEGAKFVRNHEYSSNYVKNAQFLMDYADDESNNIVLRYGSASIAGIGMIGAITVDGVADGFKWIGGQVSSGWNAITGLF